MWAAIKSTTRSAEAQRARSHRPAAPQRQATKGVQAALLPLHTLVRSRVQSAAAQGSSMTQREHGHDPEDDIWPVLLLPPHLLWRCTTEPFVLTAHSGETIAPDGRVMVNRQVWTRRRRYVLPFVLFPLTKSSNIAARGSSSGPFVLTTSLCSLHSSKPSRRGTGGSAFSARSATSAMRWPCV